MKKPNRKKTLLDTCDIAKSHYYAVLDCVQKKLSYFQTKTLGNERRSLYYCHVEPFAA